MKNSIFEHEKEVAINNIVNRYYKKHKYLLLTIVFIIFVILLNIFPLRPVYKEYSDETLNFYETNFSEYRNKYPNIQNSKSKLYDAENGKIVLITNDMKSGTSNVSYTDYISYIGKFNNSFDNIWSIGGEDGFIIDNYYIYLYDLIELNDGTIFAAGRAVTRDDTNVGDLVLMRISSDGVNISYKLFSELNLLNYKNNYKEYDDMYSISFDMVKTIDEGFTIFANSIYEDNYLMIHLNSNGDVLWNKDFTFKDNHKIDISVTYDYDGNYYISGSSYHVSNIEHVNNYNDIVKLSKDGKKLWTKTYDFKINSLYISNNNHLIVSGATKKNRIINKKLVKLVTLKDSLDEDNWKYKLETYEGFTYTNVVEINKDNGKINWETDYDYIGYENLPNYKILEDEEGNLYSYQMGEKDILVKYNSKGKLIGAANIKISKNDNYYNDLEYFEQFSRLSINDNKLEILNLRSQEIGEINLDNIEWKVLEKINYNEIKFYVTFLYFRVWVNRTLLLILLLIPIMLIWYDEFEMRKAIKLYERKRKESEILKNNENEVRRL